MLKSMRDVYVGILIYGDKVVGCVFKDDHMEVFLKTKSGGNYSQIIPYAGSDLELSVKGYEKAFKV